MVNYIIYFFSAFVFSAVFAIAGVGSSLALIPIFTILSMEFTLAKALGILANGAATICVTFHNLIYEKQNRKIIIFLFAIIALVSGLLGVGGGGLYLPLLICFGLKPKDSIIIVSALIPFISFSSFFTYWTYIHIDWRLILIVLSASMPGGLLGVYLMKKIKNDAVLKKFISAVLLAIALIMIYNKYLVN